MRYFAIAVLVLMVGCGTDAMEEESIYPFTVGAWQVNSPTNASWVGMSSDISASFRTMDVSEEPDTIDLREPGDHELSLYREDDSPPNYFMITFTDHTLDRTIRAEESIIISPTIVMPKGESPDIPDPYPILVENRNSKWSDDLHRATFNGQVACRHSFDDEVPVITILYERQDGTLFRTYRIFVNGISDAVHEIAC